MNDDNTVSELFRLYDEANTDAGARVTIPIVDVDPLVRDTSKLITSVTELAKEYSYTRHVADKFHQLILGLEGLQDSIERNQVYSGQLEYLKDVWDVIYPF